MTQAVGGIKMLGTQALPGRRFEDGRPSEDDELALRCVAAMIVVQIGFHIVLAVHAAVRQGNDKDSDRWMSSDMVEDEMVKTITAKAGRATAVGSGVGFVAALIVLALGGVPAVALHVRLWCTAAGSLVEGGLTVWYSERGVGHA